MNYLEFRTAGFRNLEVCKNLILNLETCSASNKKHLLHKIFYLSGYVIEFGFKFALFSNEGVKTTTDIYKYKDETFRRKWKEHDFNKLKNLCIESKCIFSSDIPYYGNSIKNQNINNLLKAWNVQIRYSISLSNLGTLSLDEDTVKEFLLFVDQAFNNLTSKYF